MMHFLCDVFLSLDVLHSVHLTAICSENCDKRTSRDRPKSAPYPRLKNSKRTSKFQTWSILFYSTENFFCKKSQNAEKNWKRGTLGIFLPSLSQNPKQLKGGPFGEKCFSEKSHAMPKKTERGDSLVSSGIVCYAGNFLVLFPGRTGEIWNFVEL